MQQARLKIVTVNRIIIMKTEISPELFSSMVSIIKTLQDVTLLELKGLVYAKLILVIWTIKYTTLMYVYILDKRSSIFLFSQLAVFIKEQLVINNDTMNVFNLIAVLYNFYITSYLKYRVIRIFNMIEIIFMKI